MSISDYRKLAPDHDAADNQECTESTPDLRDFLLSRSGPFSDDFEIERIVRERADDLFRDVDL